MGYMTGYDHDSSSTMKLILDELDRARAKFPGGAHLMDALIEEVGELAKALLEKEPFERVLAEAIQVACVAARIAEEGVEEHPHTKALRWRVGHRLCRAEACTKIYGDHIHIGNAVKVVE